MPTPRTISQKEFDRLKREVQVFIITAMPIEEDAVINRLAPIADSIIPLYNNYRFGYFGQFLVAHQRAGQANLNAATAITSMLTEFGISSSSRKNFYVFMLGIACGLARSKEDQTIIFTSQLKKYLDPNALLTLPLDIEQQLKSLLEVEKDKDKITLPLFLTPEHLKPTSNQRIGDILPIRASKWEITGSITKESRICSSDKSNLIQKQNNVSSLVSANTKELLTF